MEEITEVMNMAGKKKVRRKRSIPVRIMPIVSVVSLASDFMGKPVLDSGNPVQKAADGMSTATAQITGMSGRSPIRGILTLAGSGFVSSGLAQLAPQAKLKIGRYVVRL